MKSSHSTFSTLTVAAVTVLLVSCGAEEPSGPAGTAGGAAGGAGAFAGQGGALGAAGMAVAGFGGGGSGGQSSAGTSGTTSSAGASGAESSVPATFDTLKLVLGGGGGIMPCAAAPCHGVNGVAPPDRPLELPPNDDPQLYANLTAYVSRACNDTKLVTPGKPEQSALVTILKGPCGMTPRMPYGCSAEAGDCIPDEYIEAVAQWIANGAPGP